MIKIESDIKLDEATTDKDKIIVKILEWTYKKALNPDIKGVSSAYDLSTWYLKTKGNLTQQCDNLIFSQKVRSGSTGFMLGLGGIITLPATIPADFTSILFIQIRLIIAIAIMTKYDENDHRVKVLVYSCLSNTVKTEVINEIKSGIVSNVVQQGTSNIIETVAITHGSREALKTAQAAAISQITSNMGAKGLSHFTKIIPFLGGIVGATFNSFYIHKIGKRAKLVFL